jgi:hypothetical protein
MADLLDNENNQDTARTQNDAVNQILDSINLNRFDRGEEPPVKVERTAAQDVQVEYKASSPPAPPAWVTDISENIEIEALAPPFSPRIAPPPEISPLPPTPKFENVEVKLTAPQTSPEIIPTVPKSAKAYRTAQPPNYDQQYENPAPPPSSTTVADDDTFAIDIELIPTRRLAAQNTQQPSSPKSRPQTETSAQIPKVISPNALKPDESKEIPPKTLYSSKGIDGPAAIDQLTQVDALAVAAMLKAKSGDKIPGAEGLRIKVNGKIVAEADANGTIIQGKERTPPSLTEHFSRLAKEPDRPLDGSIVVSAMASKLPLSGGKSFLNNAAQDVEEQQRLRDLRSTHFDQETAAPTIEDANTIIGLYSLKEPGEASYQLKNNGFITVTTTENGKEQYEVSEADGDVEMRFSVGPRGGIVLEPQISGKLQGEIAALNQAYSRGELAEAPLISTDTIRAQAAFNLAQNIGNTVNSPSPDLKIKTSPLSGRVEAQSASGQKMMIAPNGKGRGFSIRSNSFSTDEMKKLNQSFSKTIGTEQTTTAELSQSPSSAQKLRSPAKKTARGGR